MTTRREPPRISGSFIGLSEADSGGITPPDTQVAAGPHHIFEVTNTSGRIWNKTGQRLATFTLDAFFGLPRSNFTIDPRIRFDPGAERWYVLAVTTNGIVLAVSATSNPTGHFTIYHYPFSHLPDYPKLGFSADKVVFTDNAFVNGGYVGTEIMVLNKANLLAGTAAAATYFPPPQGLITIEPAASLSATSTLYMAATDIFSTNFVRLWQVNGVPGVRSGVTLHTTDRGIRTLSTPPAALQKGTPQAIDTLVNWLMDASYRNGVLWLSAPDACTPAGDTRVRACLRYLRVLTSNLTVSQDFTFGTTGDYYFYPAVQTTADGSAVTVFSKSSTTEYASVYAGEHAAGDPANTLRPPVLVKAGEGPYGGGRWGDYSGAAVDPSQQTTVWVAGEYVQGTTGRAWGTWIAHVYPRF